MEKKHSLYLERTAVQNIFSLITPDIFYEFISVINQLDAYIFFYNKFISCLYMFRANVLIIRRSKLHYTASGIITPIGMK